MPTPQLETPTAVIRIPVSGHSRLQITVHQTTNDGDPLNLPKDSVIFLKGRMAETLFGRFWDKSSVSYNNDQFVLSNATAPSVLTGVTVESVYIGAPPAGALAFNGNPAEQLLTVSLLINHHKYTVSVPLLDAAGSSVRAGLIYYGEGQALYDPTNYDLKGFYTVSLQSEIA